MTDLKIIRDNFSTMMDEFEEADISIDTIKKKTQSEQIGASVLIDYFIHEVVKKSVPLFSDEVKEKFEKSATDLVKAGIAIGQNGFLSMLLEGNLEEENYDVTIN